MNTDPRTFRLSVFGVICLALLIASGLAAWRVYHQVTGKVLRELSEEIPAPLQAAMPEKAGIWLDRRRGATLIATLARKEGRDAKLDLSVQRSLATKDPDRLVPIHFLGDFDDLRRQVNLRGLRLKNPVVVPVESKRGMPALTVSGRVTVAGRSSLWLSASGATAETWRLLSDRSPQGQALGESGIAMDREAWLLWRRAPGSVATAFGMERFDFAIRLRREPASEKVSSVLSLSFFAAAPEEKSGGRHIRLADLTVLPLEGNAASLRLAAGEYHIPASPPPALEDKALFDALLAGGLIRLDHDQTIRIAPVDLPDALDREILVPGWSDLQAVSPHERDLLKRLYTKADGQYVRMEINRFNQERIWCAVRVRPEHYDYAEVTHLSDPRNWSAQVDGKKAPVAVGMPDIVVRLFDTPPEGWGDWQRLATRPPGTGSESLVHFSLRLPPNRDKSLQLLALGRIVAVNGGTFSPVTPACSGPGCPAPDTLQSTWVRPDPAARSLELTIGFDSRFHALGKTGSEGRRIRLAGGRLSWRQAPSSGPGQEQASAVQIMARDNSILFADHLATPQAAALGLSTMVGGSEKQANSLAGMLSRPGSHSQAGGVARLTIEPELQALATGILDCTGQQGRVWQADRQVCSESAFAEEVRGRRAGLVVLDAGSGEILVAAGSPQPGLLTTPAEQAELAAFDRFNPGASPLRISAWQHDGEAEAAAGSTFKLVSALALEQAAASSPELGRLLDGLPLDELDRVGRRYGFSTFSASYPQSGRNTVSNFKEHRVRDYTLNGHLGLREAIENSVNSWFAWMVEQSDQTLLGGPAGGLPGALPLGGNSLDRWRPVSAIAHRLGFERQILLDGELLPADYRWQNRDALRATPAGLDPIADRHMIRQQAIGLRMQVTPLQMAMTAAGIGEGRLIRPRLLAELNGRQAASQAGEPLGVRLDRIRAGMKAVVAEGTAKNAFRSPNLAALIGGIYGKTGTAPGPDFNTAWFIGYIEPGTIPGEKRRLAFAVMVSRTRLTGGGHAAPVVASLVESLVLRRAQATKQQAFPTAATGKDLR